MIYTFIIDDKKYEIESEDSVKAMLKINREVVDKQNLHPMAWFDNNDDKSIPVNTWKLLRGNFYD